MKYLCKKTFERDKPEWPNIMNEREPYYQS